MVTPIRPTNPLVVAVHEITEPLLAPIRQLLPRFGMIDLSPFIAIIVLNVIGRVVQRL